MAKEGFGELLIILRTQRGIKQNELAERLHVSASAVSKWEHGGNMPDIDMIEKIARILEVEDSELIHPERTLQKLRKEEPIRMAGETDTEPDNEQDTEQNAEPDREADGENPEGISGKASEKIFKVSGKAPVKSVWVKHFLKAILIFLLGAVSGYMLRCFTNREVNSFPQIITARYVYDAFYDGKVFEISCVARHKMNMDKLKEYRRYLGEIYIQGETVDEDTMAVRVEIYANEADALKRVPTDIEIMFFYDKPGEEKE